MDASTPPAGQAVAAQPQAAPARVVALGQADADRVLAVDSAAFFFDPSGVQVERDTAHFDWSRTFGAVRDEGDGGPLAGLYTSYAMAVTAPGPLGALRRVPMAGLSWVSVHPDERRRGVLRAMLAHHFRRLHDAGEFLGGLHAAEVGIYGRFGYAVASLSVSLTVPHGTTLTAPGLDRAAGEVRTRFGPTDDRNALLRLQDVHARAADVTPGVVTRPDSYLFASNADRPERRPREEPSQLMFAYRQLDGAAGFEPTGFAVFHRVHQWESGLPTGTLKVEEMAAVDGPSLLALARRLVDFDLISTTTFSGRSIEDPLVWWTGSPRGVDLAVHDGLWLRLVDVDAALAARGYSQACDVVLDVVDSVCPWNHGLWRLRVDPDGSATCTRTDEPAEIRLPVQALAAAYLGSRTLMGQQTAGGIDELRPGSLWPLSRAMSGDREPVGAIDF